MRICCYVLESDKEVDIYNDFREVNKSVPVPQVYLEDFHKKELCENIAKYFITTYKNFKVTTSSPRKPNFNQDTIMDKFNEIITADMTLPMIINAIEKINIEVKNNLNLNEIPKKCVQDNFYLFMDKDWTTKVRDFLTKPLIEF